jgi:pyruvate, water dikinase
MDCVNLPDVHDASRFGGKAVSLGYTLRAGLPVPPGVALASDLVDRIAARDAAALRVLVDSAHLPQCARLAVRSSGIGEDGAAASFAGQHATKLNVTTASLEPAIRAVWESARSASAMAYRVRHQLPVEPKIGVVVQLLVEPVCAGVLFTRNPITGADERVIEAAWGLGEAVVNGIVVPDRVRVARDRTVLESVAGHKDVKVWFATGGDGEGTVEVEVPPALHAAPCLDGRQLDALLDLAEACERVSEHALDLEWACTADTIYLLQSRPITTLTTST